MISTLTADLKLRSVLFLTGIQWPILQQTGLPLGVFRSPPGSFPCSWKFAAFEALIHSRVPAPQTHFGKWSQKSVENLSLKSDSKTGSYKSICMKMQGYLEKKKCIISFPCIWIAHLRQVPGSKWRCYSLVWMERNMKPNMPKSPSSFKRMKLLTEPTQHKWKRYPFSQGSSQHGNACFDQGEGWFSGFFLVRWLFHWKKEELLFSALLP